MSTFLHEAFYFGKFGLQEFNKAVISEFCYSTAEYYTYG